MRVKSYCFMLLLIVSNTSAFAAIEAQSSNGSEQNRPLANAASSTKQLKNTQLSDSQKKRLDLLFTQLASSDSESKARQLVAEIWSIWKNPVDTELVVKMTGAEQLFVRGKRKEAFAILDEAVEAYPDYSEIWNLRATYYYFDGRYEDSLNDIAKVLELEPRHFGAMSGKIAILMQKKRMAPALEVLQQALKINPFMPERRILKPQKQQAPKGLAI